MTMKGLSGDLSGLSPSPMSSFIQSKRQLRGRALFGSWRLLNVVYDTVDFLG